MPSRGAQRFTQKRAASAAPQFQRIAQSRRRPASELYLARPCAAFGFPYRASGGELNTLSVTNSLSKF